MDKTELFFFVTALQDCWVVQSEDEFYGPFGSYRAAFGQAVTEAQAAGIYGFASAVLVRRDDAGPFSAGWTFGRDAFPPSGPREVH